MKVQSIGQNYQQKTSFKGYTEERLLRQFIDEGLKEVVANAKTNNSLAPFQEHFAGAFSKLREFFKADRAKYEIAQNDPASMRVWNLKDEDSMFLGLENIPSSNRQDIVLTSEHYLGDSVEGVSAVRYGGYQAEDGEIGLRRFTGMAFSETQSPHSNRGMIRNEIFEENNGFKTAPDGYYYDFPVGEGSDWHSDEAELDKALQAAGKMEEIEGRLLMAERAKGALKAMREGKPLEVALRENGLTASLSLLYGNGIDKKMMEIGKAARALHSLRNQISG